jgi:hypothetical protein
MSGNHSNKQEFDSIPINPLNPALATADKQDDIIAALGSTIIPTSIVNGRKLVSITGTAVPVVNASTPCKRFIITALDTNTDVVVVGGVGVIFASATREGIPLMPNQAWDGIISDLNKIYLNGTANEGISFSYLV